MGYDPPFLCFYTEPFKVMVFIAQSLKGKKHNFSCCAGKNDFSFVDVEYVYNPRWAHSSTDGYSRERRFLSNILNFLKLSVIERLGVHYNCCTAVYNDITVFMPEEVNKHLRRNYIAMFLLQMSPFNNSFPSSPPMSLRIQTISLKQDIILKILHSIGGNVI